MAAFDLPVVGTIPRGLRGRYVRNGPNPKTGTSHHWFVGDGMLHGVELRDGRAVWYRNRWVRTRSVVEDAKMLREDYTKDIVDAADVTGKPVATIALPQRVPFGFHGSWIPDA